MANTSSLLRTAAARRAAIQNEKNRIADMEWNLSAKTEEDLAVYLDHYSSAVRSAKPSDAISYQNKIISAQRTFKSAQIQRASIDVLEGRSDNQSKQNLMVDLYNSAIENGDYSQAQSLRLQIDNLQNTIIQEQVSMLNTAKQMAEAGYKDTKAFVSDLKAGRAPILGGYSLNEINDIYKRVGPAGMQPVLDAIGEKLGLPTASYVDILHAYATETLNNMQVAAQNLPADDAANVYNDMNNIISGKNKFDVPGLTGDMGLTYDDILRAKEAQINGSSPIVASQNAADGRPGFARAELANWTSVLDANGNFVVSPNYVQGNKQLTSNVQSMDSAGRKQIDVTINGVTKQYFTDANGAVFNEFGQKVAKDMETLTKAAPTAEIKPHYMAAQDVLKQQGFGVNGNLVDIPNAENAPPELAGAKNIKYWVDNNGRIQFTFEAKDQNGNPYRDSYTYDPQTSTYEKASLAAVVSAQNRQMFAENYGGATQQSGLVANALQSPKTASNELQKISQEQIQATAKAQVQQAASAKQLNTIPNQPLKVAPIPQQNAPLQVINTPQPTQPLKVVNTPQNANVKVVNTPITQGLVPTVKVVNTPQTGTLKVQ